MRKLYAELFHEYAEDWASVRLYQGTPKSALFYLYHKKDSDEVRIFKRREESELSELEKRTGMWFLHSMPTVILHLFCRMRVQSKTCLRNF